MNYKITVDQMLKDFSGGFLEFRDAFHKITNDVADYELNRNTNPVQTNDEQINSRIEAIDAEIVKLKGETPDPKLPAEEQNYVNERNATKLNGLYDERNVLIAQIEENKKTVKDDKKAYNDKVTEFKEELKANIVKMRETLGEQVVNGEKVTIIDMLKDQLTQQIKLVSFQLANRAADLTKAKGMDKEPIAKDIEKMNKQRKQMTDLLEKLDVFMVEFEKLETKYVEKNSNVDVFAFQKINEQFESIANTINKNVDKNLIVVNVIKNSDGTYSIDMRCGNMIADPRPLITADKFNKKTVADYVKGFASVVASKSDLSMEVFEESKVALKENGVDKGRFDFKNFGELAVKEITNGEEIVQEKEEPTVEEPTVETPVVEEPTVEEPAVETPTVEESTPEKPAVEEPGIDEKDIPEVDPVQQTREEQETHHVGDMENDVVYKVVSARNARRGKYNVAKTVLATAAIGLGFAGIPLGFGLAPAAIAGGAYVATAVVEALGDGLTKLRYNATRRKLKKIARKCGVQYEENYENGTAHFVLVDDETKERDVITSSNTNGKSDMYNAQLTEELNRVFNKNRGKGENATTFAEITNRNLEPVTLDNVEAAFQEFGGIQTRKELNAYKFNPIKAFNRFKEALKPEGDELDDVDLDEVDEMTPLEHVEGEIVNAQDIPTANSEAFDMDDAQAMIDALENAEESVVEAEKVEEQPAEDNAPVDEELENLMAALNGNEPLKDMDGVQDYIDVFMSAIDDPTDVKAVSEKLAEYLEQTPELSETEKMALIDTVNATVQFDAQDYDALVEQARGKELGM